MQSHPGNFTPYNGRFRSSSVYLIAYGTEGELVLVDRKEAVRVSRSDGLSIHRVAATTIPEPVGLKLFGS